MKEETNQMKLLILLAKTMKYVLYVFILFECSCHKEDLLLNVIMHAGTDTINTTVFCPLPFNRDDSIQMVGNEMVKHPAYDSVFFYRLNGGTLSGSIYSVTNDSGIYVFKIFGYTKYKTRVHPFVIVNMN